MDARKSLEQLKNEWKDCEACSLGEHRTREGGHLVFGEGFSNRGILIVGAAPGETEEMTARPLVGDSTKILHFALKRYGITDITYLTHIVCCRSCQPALDGGGQPMTRNMRGVRVPIWRNKPPSREQLLACQPRLFEQIYIIDPVIIVTLGAPATAALLREPVTSIMNARGVSRTISIPGALRVPSLTPTGMWQRRIGGQVIRPTEPNTIEYMVLPTLDPTFVAPNLADRSPHGPGALFLRDIGEAAAIYRRYMLEIGATTELEVQGDVNMNEFEEDDE